MVIGWDQKQHQLTVSHEKWHKLMMLMCWCAVMSIPTLFSSLYQWIKHHLRWGRSLVENSCRESQGPHVTQRFCHIRGPKNRPKNHGFPWFPYQNRPIWINLDQCTVGSPATPAGLPFVFHHLSACAVNHRCRLGTNGETAAAAKPHDFEKMGGGLWHWVTMVTIC